MKILVIDDDPIVTKVTQARLQSAGYDVVTRNRPLGTAFVIANEKPDVLLLDLNMPMLSGETLAALVSSHQQTARLRIVFHSDLPRDQLAAKAREARVAGFVRKTDNDDEFIADLRAVLKGGSR